VKTESQHQENQLSAILTGIHHSGTGILAERTDTNAGRFASRMRDPQTVPKAGSGYLAPPHFLGTESE
jgi:hypothetical protein